MDKSKSAFTALLIGGILGVVLTYNVSVIANMLFPTEPIEIQTVAQGDATGDNIKNCWKNKDSIEVDNIMKVVFCNMKSQKPIFSRGSEPF